MTNEEDAMDDRNQNALVDELDACVLGVLARQRREDLLLHRLMRRPARDAKVRADRLFRTFMRGTPIDGFAVVASPGEPLQTSLRGGDLLVRVALGEPSLGHVAILVDGVLHSPDALAAAGFQLEGPGRGLFAHVIEAGASPRPRIARFARRIVDANGRLLPDQMLLRSTGAEVSAASDASDAEGSGISKSNSARLEWQELNLVTGGDVRQHLYYLTSGPPGGGPSTFRLKVTNTNSVYNFLNTRLRLKLQASDGATTIPFEQQGDKLYLDIRSDNIEDESSRVIDLHLTEKTRRAAYDPDDPRRYLYAEFHWWEERIGPNAPFYNSTRLGFYLVGPVEFLFGRKRLLRRVPFSDRAKFGQYWTAAWEKLFQEADQTNVKFVLKVQAAITESESGAISTSYQTTVTQGTERAVEVGLKSTSKLGVSLEQVLNIGMEMESSYKESLKWSASTARQFTRVLTRSKTYTQALTQEQQVEMTIPPAPPGKRMVLYFYPVFNLWEVPIVLFGKANALGQATSRSEGKSAVMMFSHWGTTTQIEDGEMIRPPEKRGPKETR
jgi:hypothetical protein